MFQIDATHIGCCHCIRSLQRVFMHDCSVCTHINHSSILHAHTTCADFEAQRIWTHLARILDAPSNACQYWAHYAVHLCFHALLTIAAVLHDDDMKSQYLNKSCLPCMDMTITCLSVCCNIRRSCGGTTFCRVPAE